MPEFVNNTPEEEEIDLQETNGTATKLVLKFMSATGSEITMNYNYVDPEVEAASVKALMEGIIANGSIFANVPTAMTSAKVVTTEETLIDLDA